MNRKIGLLFVALMMVVAVSVAQAAAKGDCHLGVSGGLSIPSGDLSKDFTEPKGMGAGMGFNGGVLFDYMVTENVAVGVDGTFRSNNLKSDQRDLLRTALGDPTADLKYTGIGGGAHVKFFLPMKDSKVSPYLVAGGAVTNFKAKLEGATPTDTSVTKFGGFGGIGAGFSAGQANVGLEADYHITPIGDPLGTGSDVTASWIDIKAVITFPLGGSKGK